jgi:hypothetical protein
MFNVSSIVGVQVVGIYLKVCHVGRVGNLRPMTLLESNEPFRSNDC